MAVLGDCATAVCVQHGANLTLEGISNALQDHLRLQPCENVIFARLQHGAYRDGVRFGNGRELSLQQLGPGVSVALVEARPAPKPAAEMPAQSERILEPAE